MGSAAPKVAMKMIDITKVSPNYFVQHRLSLFRCSGTKTSSNYISRLGVLICVQNLLEEFLRSFLLWIMLEDSVHMSMLA